MLSWPKYRLKIFVLGCAAILVGMLWIIIANAISPPSPNFISLKNVFFVFDILIGTTASALLFLFLVALHGVATSINNHTATLRALEFELSSPVVASAEVDSQALEYLARLRAQVEEGAKSFTIFGVAINEATINALATLFGTV